MNEIRNRLLLQNRHPYPWYCQRNDGIMEGDFTTVLMAPVCPFVAPGCCWNYCQQPYITPPGDIISAGPLIVFPYPALWRYRLRRTNTTKQ